MNSNVTVTDSLVYRCQRGDREAFRQLYNEYSKAMYNVCLRMMNNTHDAEDMLQEAFILVFKNMESYRGEATLGAWIKRIVINKCLNQLKKSRPHFIQVDDMELKNEETTVNEEEFILSVNSIKEAIQKLPDGYRVVLSLYLFENYSHGEIAEKLGISQSTAKTQYMRAKQKIRELIALPQK